MDSKEKILKGMSGSPGICIGKAYIVEKESLNIIKRYNITKEDIEKEVGRFKSAVQKSKAELSEVIQNFPEELQEHNNIIETHISLYKDKMLYERTIEQIEKNLINAEWALKKTLGQIKKIFANISDERIKSRFDDISQVVAHIFQHLSGGSDINISKIDKRVILVAKDLSPAQTSQIHLERVKGFITDLGSKASHTSIIAKALQIPSVMGLKEASRLICHDDLIIVDGINGIVIINPTEESLIKYENLTVSYEESRALIVRKSGLPAKTKDNFEIKLMGNIEFPEEIVSVKDNGGDGIGLFRTEFLYLQENRFPNEEELFSKYKEVVEMMAPMPVTIRTFDLGGEKVNKSKHFEEDKSPLGLRAIRFSLNNPDLFETQLKAILRAAYYGNAKILIPMISSCEEIEEVKKIIKKVEKKLEDKKIPFKKDISLGIMIEVPSAVIIAEKFAKMVDFFSIGTNDLIQYSLAIDRTNHNLSYLYNPRHPAIIKMLKMLVEVCNEFKIDISICGEMAGEKINIPILLGLGIKELSVNAPSIPIIKDVVRQLERGYAKKVFEELLEKNSAKEIEEVLKASYKDILV